MLRHYVTTAVRNLLKYKGYSLINILGLAIGMACCILTLLYILDELSYDRFHEDADRVFRVVAEERVPGRTIRNSTVPAPLGPTLVKDIPGVVSYTRIKAPTSAWMIRYEDKAFNEKGFFLADSSLFDVFTYELIQGNPKTALNQPYTAVLTEEMAKKYFGDENPMGKVVRADEWKNFTITGILKSPPRNSHLNFDFLASLVSFEEDPPYALNTWQRIGLNIQYHTYIRLSPTARPEDIERQLPAILEKYMADQIASGINLTLTLQPLTDIHLHSHLANELAPNSDITSLYLFSAIVIFILIIACINFMNLATARSAGRGREIGMRKVVGAGRWQLARQFLGESIVLSFIALGIAIIMAVILLPLFNTMAEKALSFSSYNLFLMVVGFTGLAIIVGIIAGIYPAILLSAFRPVDVLKGGAKTGSRNTWLRKILVTFQFAISIILIIGTFTVYQQLEYFRNARLGFDKEQVVVIGMHFGEVRGRYGVFRNELLNDPGILKVAITSEVPGRMINVANIIFRRTGTTAADNLETQSYFVDHDYAETLGLTLLAGRFFSRDRETNFIPGLVLNRTAVNRFGWSSPEEAIGKTLDVILERELPPDTPPPPKFPVIGVVEDYHLQSLHHPIQPIMIRGPVPEARFMLIKIAPDDISRTLSMIEETWRKINTNFALEYSFLDEDFNKLYKAEYQFGQVYGTFAFIAIVVACLGLFGLAAFTTQQRTKEIGVRKVMGASTGTIVRLLVVDFVRWVALANVIAWPLAWYMASQWLENFAYRIDMNPIPLLAAGLAALLIAVLTVLSHAWRTAVINPARALRYE